jgi:hypothetical protein
VQKREKKTNYEMKTKKKKKKKKNRQEMNKKLSQLRFQTFF